MTVNMEVGVSWLQFRKVLVPTHPVTRYHITEFRSCSSSNIFSPDQ